MFKFSKIEKKLFYILGLFCTFTALKFGGGAAAFNYVILLIIVLQFIHKERIFLYAYKVPMYLFILLMPISIILNFTNISNSIMSDGVGITIKFIFFILPVIILFSDKELCIYRLSFFKGLYMGSWIQLIWGTMQIILYHVNGLILNQIVFGNLLHITLESADWASYTGIGIRATGIGWEPAVYGLSLLFGFAYTDKFYFKVLFAIGILSSTSGTGIITLIALVIYEITIDKYLTIKNKTIEGKDEKNNSVVKLFFIILVIIVITIIAVICNKDIIDNFISYANTSIQRITRIILGENNNETSTGIHMLYYQKLIPTLFSGNFIQSLFGYGNFMVGRIYNLLYGLYTNTAWNPESDFVTILIGNGILGLVLYYFMIYKAFRLCRNVKLRKYLFIIFISGFSYLFIRGTFTFIIILLLMIKDNNKNAEYSSYKY